MWSNLRLFRRQDGFAFIERRSLRDAQLKELKKYAVFSKVTIAPDDEHVLLGSWFRARAALKTCLPSCRMLKTAGQRGSDLHSVVRTPGGALPAGNRRSNGGTRH